MKKYLVAIIAGVVALAAAIFLIAVKSSQNVNYQDYDLDTILVGTPDNGNIADHVKGNPSAPVLLYEYADFQCPGCATLNPRINTLLEEYGDQLGVVYRNYLLSYHQNGTAAASAAEAAGLQGYWEDYANLLFNNQNAWGSASAEDRNEIFEQYFRQVAGNDGDLDKFRADMTSAEVSKKLKFDIGAGNYIGVDSTPTVILNGEKLDFTGHSTTDDFLEYMRGLIDAELEKSSTE